MKNSEEADLTILLNWHLVYEYKEKQNPHNT